MGDVLSFDLELDARGLRCPLPILRCKKALAQIEPDQVLKLMATDPGSVKDFEAFCRQTGHALLQAAHTPDTFVFYIKKRA